MVFAKKAQGLSMNTIVVAALALVVLVVMIMVYTTQIKKGTDTTSSIGDQAALEAKVKTWCIGSFAYQCEYSDATSCSGAGEGHTVKPDSNGVYSCGPNEHKTLAGMAANPNEALCCAPNK